MLLAEVSAVLSLMAEIMLLVGVDLNDGETAVRIYAGIIWYTPQVAKCMRQVPSDIIQIT